MSDVATALTNSLAKNGETTPTGDLPMGTNKHTNVGDGSARNHYGAIGQIQDNDFNVVGSVAGTNTVTGSLTPAITSYSAGMIIVLTPANDNTSTVTLALNGLTALDVQKLSGSALSAGDLKSGVPAVLVLDSGADDWILLNPQARNATGSFTGTLTGFGSSPTPTIGYTIIDSLVILSAPSTGSTGTSNSTQMTMTGMPAVIRPSVTRVVPCLTVNDGSPSRPSLASIATSGTITFQTTAASGSFSSSAYANTDTKGLTASSQIIYTL